MRIYHSSGERRIIIDRLEELDGDLEVVIGYAGDGNALKGATLDHQVIPVIVEALKREFNRHDDVEGGCLVTIRETIVETREYRVRTSDPREAAQEVKSLWIDNGIHSCEPPQLEVIEREYASLDNNGEVHSIDISEVEID